MFSSIIRELGRLLDLPMLAPDATGALTLRIDGQDFVLQYFGQGQDIYVVHRLGTLPEDEGELLRVQRLLLERNCFFRGTGPGSIGTEGRDIYYTVRLRADGLDGREMEQFLRAITAACDRLRRDMASCPAQDSDCPPTQNILWG